MSDTNRLEAAARTEFGKGAARRARRDGLVPAVLYGHGTDPVHVNLPARDFARVLRENGTNAILNLVTDGNEHLALTKSVVVHPIRNYIEHADLLVITRGEKVSVEVPIHITGDAAPGSLVTQELNHIEIEADAMSIPESIELSIEGAEIGTQFLTGQVVLPAGATLVADPELLLVNIVEAQAAGGPAEAGEEEAAAEESASEE